MKKLFTIVICFFASYICKAGHIAGGEVFYVYRGAGTLPNTAKYEITLRLFRECNPPVGGQPTAEMPLSVIIGIFTNSSPASLYTSREITGGAIQTINLTPGPCVINAPEVCYQVRNFVYTVDLLVNSVGYTAAFQTCCRTNGIANLPPSPSQGATYTADIPGTSLLSNANNSSAVFSLKDATLICKNLNFTLDFGATDPDGDSLSYSFCPAFNGGNTTNSTNVIPSVPPYGTVSYQSPFSGSQPLGSAVTINPRTGLISGISPNAGSYVINVCVSEFRNGQLLTIHRKDFTLKIGNCNIAAADLNPNVFFLCDSLTRSFVNGSTSSGITSYAWNFGDPVSGAGNTSALPNPIHTYSDTGIFILQLTVQNSAGCVAKDSATIKVYPGFNGDFNVTGSCFQTPFQFIDKTTTSYGTIDTWKWDFGDLATLNDTSGLKNPSYRYLVPGTVNAQLIVTNTKGCADTVTKTVLVRDIPALTLPFKDTLICSIDTLRLIAQGSGTFSWTPNNNIINPNSSSPLVFPKDTAIYIVTLNENGCVKADTVKVNVLDFITVNAGRDTSMCQGDTITLRAVSQALKYTWSPSTTLNNANIKNPVARPLSSTTYYVTANLGKCQDRDSINIRVGPYPKARAGNDTTICYGDNAQLSGTTVGSYFTWNPVSTLQSGTTLTPVAHPLNTTSYVLSAYDTIGCPKPFSDTIVVKVNPQVIAFAGNDTVVVANQPLQLTATGGSIYAWTPSTGMSDANIANPVITLGSNYDSISYTVLVSLPPGCFASDEVKVKVFKTGPEIFVPGAFTPNGDGKNDLLKPILVGMKTLTYFRIFNRWGQLVYSTSEIGKGWNGKVAGIGQSSGTFVYMAEATDYLGKTVTKRGTVILIR